MVGKSLKIIASCGLSLIIVFGCALPRFLDKTEKASGPGRILVLKALVPPEAPQTGAKPALMSALLSSADIDLDQPLKGFPPGQPPRGRPFVHRLADGTTVGGLLFEHRERKEKELPLLIAGFGFLQDRWGTAVFNFYEQSIADPSHRLAAHVLIIDHPSSAPFLAENGVLSMGSYDEARIWIDVARRFKTKYPGLRIHLFGVGMSGQTVVHALIEDRRLGLDLFESGLAVSITPDFRQVPGRQLALIDTAEGVQNPWRQGLTPYPANAPTDALQRQVLMRMIEKLFIANYRRINPTHTNFTLPSQKVPLFFRQAFENRITFLRSQTRIPETWNFGAFSLDNLDAFMQTTRIGAVIAKVQTPLVLISARDDMAVTHSQFKQLAQAAADNPWVVCHATDHGGHYGFDAVYGKTYLEQVLKLMLDAEIIRTWLQQK